MDALRAPRVAHIDDAFRFYCSPHCHSLRLDPVAPSSSPRTRSLRPRGAHSILPDAPSLRPRGAHSTLPDAPSLRPPLAPSDLPDAPLPAAPSVEAVAALLGLERTSLPPELRTDLDPASVAPAPRAPLRVRVRAALSALDRALADHGALVALSAVVLAHLVAVPSWRPARVLAVSLTAPLAVLATAVALTTARRLARAHGHPFAWSVVAAAPVVALLASLRPPPGSDAADVLASATVFAIVLPAVALITARGASHVAALFDRLVATLPDTVRVRPHGVRSVADVRAGETVCIAAGDVIAVDGVVQSGSGRVSMPLDSHLTEARTLSIGEPVLAGSRLADGEIDVLATRAGDDVALARLSRLAHAPGSRPVLVRTADRVARASLWIALGAVAAVTAFTWLFSTGDVVERARMLCVIALGPLALAPVVTRWPFGRAAAEGIARGVVFRDAPAIASAAAVGTVVLAVRGTATTGVLEAVEVIALGAHRERDVVAIAAAAEQADADHPVAEALLAYVAARGIALAPVRRPVVVPGRGITAVDASGAPIVVGARELCLAEGISVAPAEDLARAIELQGRTALFVAVGGRLEGLVGLEDRLRDEARPAVQSMMDAGVHVVLLGGESRGTLEALGLALDVGDVRPEVSPDERAATVRAIAEVSGPVAMVGRAPRDGTALAAADVAISLTAAGAAGAETAIALATDDLRSVASALGLARSAVDRARRVAAVAWAGGAVLAGTVALVPALGPRTLVALVCVHAVSIVAIGAGGLRRS